MSDGLNSETLRDLVNLGRLSVEPKEVTGGTVPYIIIPNDSRVEDLSKFKFNDHAERPERIKANVSVLDPESFCEYYKLFADDNSRIFASEPERRVMAILDYHESATTDADKQEWPRWCAHKLTLTLRLSEEWVTWCQYNGLHMTQMAFAEFLEQAGLDVTDPSPATMAEVARDLEARTDVEFSGGAKTNSGAIVLKYSETTKASMANGTLSVPETFRITLPVFIGGEPINVLALLRYRLNGGKLSLFYSLVRPEAAIREAFLAARDFISSELGVSILNGSPA